VPAPKAEERGRRSERLGEVGERRNPDTAPDEKRSFDGEVEAVPERTEHVDRLARLERGEGSGSRPDRIDEKGQLARRRETQAHRARQHPPRSFEHEELARDSRLEPSALESQKRVRPDLLPAGDGEATATGLARPK
jgi:hypothetical protein